MRHGVYLSLLISLICVVNCEECPKGWVRVLNKCYFRLPVFVTREENLEFCSKMKAELPSINNEFENRMISAMTAGASSWLGAIRVGTSQKYQWNGDKDLGFTSWAQGEPSTNLDSDFCVTMNDGVWRSVACDSKHFVLCQLNIEDETQCEIGWLRYEDKCFIVNEAYTKLIENEIHCRKMGATMVTIHGELENAFIDAMTKRETFYWLGGHREKFGSRTFKWFDGTPFDYTKWDTHAHDNRYGNQPEDYENNTCIFNGHWHDCGPEVDRYPHLCHKYVHETNGDINTRVELLTQSVKYLKDQVLDIGTIIHKLLERFTSLRSEATTNANV